MRRYRSNYGSMKSWRSEFRTFTESPASYYEGDLVRILEGPYRGLTGMVTLSIMEPGRTEVYVQINHPVLQMRGPIPFPPSALERKATIDRTYVDAVAPRRKPILHERTETPSFVKHCVRAVAPKYGGDTSRAFAICISQMQKAGLIHPGSKELTAAGRKAAKKHSREKGHAMKVAEYEGLLKRARKTKREGYDASEPFLDPSDFTIRASRESGTNDMVEQILYFAGVREDETARPSTVALPDARIAGIDLEDYALAESVDADMLADDVRDLAEWEEWMYEAEPEDLAELRQLIRRSVRGMRKRTAKTRKRLGKKMARAGAAVRSGARQVKQSRRERRAMKKWTRRAVKHAKRGDMERARAYAAGVHALRKKRQSRAAQKRSAKVAKRARVAGIKRQLAAK